MWKEYDSAAEWCAKRGFTGAFGSPLPPLLSKECFDEITANPEEFADRVKSTAYMLAMKKPKK